MKTLWQLVCNLWAALFFKKYAQQGPLGLSKFERKAAVDACPRFIRYGTYSRPVSRRVYRRWKLRQKVRNASAKILREQA